MSLRPLKQIFCSWLCIQGLLSISKHQKSGGRLIFFSFLETVVYSKCSLRLSISSPASSWYLEDPSSRLYINDFQTWMCTWVSWRREAGLHFTIKVQILTPGWDLRLYSSDMLSGVTWSETLNVPLSREEGQVVWQAVCWALRKWSPNQVFRKHQEQNPKGECELFTGPYLCVSLRQNGDNRGREGKRDCSSLYPTHFNPLLCARLFKHRNYKLE